MYDNLSRKAKVVKIIASRILCCSFDYSAAFVHCLLLLPFVVVVYSFKDQSNKLAMGT
jgi:hypothetical protein